MLRFYCLTPFVFFFLSLQMVLAETTIRVTELSILKNIKQAHTDKGFEIHGVLLLESLEKAPAEFSELSGLAWDKDENILYAISDEARLFHLKPIIENNQLVDVTLLKNFALKDETNTPLSGKGADSEGLAIINHDNQIKNDTELFISFERIPRVIRYSTEGSKSNPIHIPATLKDISNYKKKNKQLEALTWHKELGFITGPERPLSDHEAEIGLYSKDGLLGNLRLSHQKKGSLVGLETLPSGNLLALERVFINVFAGLQFHLHLLTRSGDGFKQVTEQSINITVADGFFNDNFEAIAHHKDDFFFMVSDDNARAIQRTLLVYFRLPGLEQETISK